MDRAWFSDCSVHAPDRSNRSPAGEAKINPSRVAQQLRMADEEGPCEWEGELDDGFPTGQVSFFARSTVHADHAREPRRAPSSCTNDA